MDWKQLKGVVYEKIISFISTYAVNYFNGYFYYFNNTWSTWFNNSIMD